MYRSPELEEHSYQLDAMFTLEILSHHFFFAFYFSARGETAAEGVLRVEKLHWDMFVLLTVNLGGVGHTLDSLHCIWIKAQVTAKRLYY